MNINNLKVGNNYKNWKELCVEVGIEAKTGRSKKFQEKEFERYFSWTKQGQKITIVEIYDTPKEKEDGRKMNGKHENSVKALEDNRHVQESFFSPDELQLAILWTIGVRAYRSKWKETTKQYGYILSNEMYFATGLCNEYLSMLTKNNRYYAMTNKAGTQDQYCCKFQYDIAFNGLYEDMKQRTLTALNQLKKKKVLDYAYWRMWLDTEGEWHIMNDMEMFEFHEARADVIDWWNENHTKKIERVIDMYNGRLTAIEFEECHDKFIYFLKQRIHQDFVQYTSCYKIFYSLRNVKRELTSRGYDSLTNFEDAYTYNMKPIIDKVNDKFLERRIGKINEVKEEHIEREEKLIQESSERKSLGRKIKDTKQPFTAMANEEIYDETVNLLELGVKHSLSKNQLSDIKEIEKVVVANKRKKAIKHGNTTL